MDANTERQVKSLARRFLPKIFRWLKKKFAASQGGSTSHQQQQQQQYQPQQQSYQPQSYAQASYGQQPSYGQPAWQGQPQQSVPFQPITNQQPYQPPSHQWTSADGNSNVTSLRNQAIAAGDRMRQCFDQAHQAHENGQGAEAKRLSDMGHQAQAERDNLNRQAARLIFQEKNARNPPGTIDLHGLYVQEAIDQAEDAVRDAQQQGLSELRIIVGKGIHSTAHVTKIKPAIEDLMEKYKLSAHLDPQNSGVLVVDLTGSGGRNSGFVREIARQQPGDDNECVIS